MTQPTVGSIRPAIPWPVFAVTVIGAFMVALDLSIVNVAFPSIEESFPDVSTAALSWVLTAYSVVMISAGVAGLALGITQGQDWGWSSIGVVSSFVAAGVLLPLSVYRARHHRAPAIDLSVFESRTVVLANAATFVYAVGFFAMLLANVLFLTSVWGYSILRAGMAITPGPLVVAAFSGYTGRLSRRIGYRPVLVAGGLVFAAGVGWYAVDVDAAPRPAGLQHREVSNARSMCAHRSPRCRLMPSLANLGAEHALSALSTPKFAEAELPRHSETGRGRVVA